MNPLEQKMISFLTNAAHEQIVALRSETEYAKKLNNIEVDDTVKEEIQKICQVATFVEMTKIALSVSRLKKASGPQREKIKRDLKRIAEKLVSRVEAESGPLKLPENIRNLSSGL
jgi:hypothetical protein